MAKFDLKTVAVEQDALSHPKVVGEAQRLLATLDRLNAEMARASRRDRIAHMLSEADGVDDLITRLRVAVGDAEQLRGTVEKTRSRLLREDGKLREALAGVVAGLGKEKQRLTARQEQIGQQIRQVERQRLEALAELTKAGLGHEEAEARAKPGANELKALRDELAALPLRLSSIDEQLRSRRHQVNLLEGKACEVVA